MTRRTRTTTRCVQVALTVAAATLLTACADGDGSDDAFSYSDDARTSAEVATTDACLPGGERSLEGRYVGGITYDATPREGAMCAWDVRATVVATSRAGVACSVKMVLDAPVEQLVVPADGAAFAGACVAEDGAVADLWLERMTVFVSAPATAPESMRYPGVVGGPLVRSVSLVSTLVPQLDAFKVDAASGALVPMQRRAIDGVALAGRLERVRD